jgi:hypothetical protein
LRNKTVIISLFVIPAVITMALYTAARFFAPATDHAVQLVPEDAFFYSSLFLKPSTEQRKALRELLKKFPGAGEPDEAEAGLDDLLNDALDDLGLRYTNDVKPWVGDEIAFFAKPPGPGTSTPVGWAVLISTEDEEAAKAALQKASPLPGSFRTVVDGFAVVGTSGAVHEVMDVAEGEPALGDTDRYLTQIELLPQDRVALAYFDPVPIFDAFSSRPEAPAIRNAFGPYATDPHAAVAYLRADAIVIESASPHLLGGHGGSTDPYRGLLEDVPESSWAAAGIDDFGSVTRFVIDRTANAGFRAIGPIAVRAQFKQATGLDLDADLLDWIGDVGLFVKGEAPNEIEGGAVIESTDPETSQATLRKIGGMLKLRGAPVHFLSGDADGFSLELPGFPDVPSLYVISDRATPERVWVGVARSADASTTDAAIAETKQLRSARSALGDGFATGFYLATDRVLELLRAAGADQDPAFEQDVAPNLEALTHIVGGSRVDGDTVYRRLVIGVE